jgi:hypothetical protein
MAGGRNHALPRFRLLIASQHIVILATFESKTREQVYITSIPPVMLPHQTTQEGLKLAATVAEGICTRMSMGSPMRKRHVVEQLDEVVGVRA